MSCNGNILRPKVFPDSVGMSPGRNGSWPRIERESRPPSGGYCTVLGSSIRRHSWLER